MNLCYACTVHKHTCMKCEAKVWTGDDMLQKKFYKNCWWLNENWNFRQFDIYFV